MFPQRSDGKHDFRVWNSQLIRYAGYQMPDGTIRGDPASLEFTQVPVQSLTYPSGQKPRTDAVPWLQTQCASLSCSCALTWAGSRAMAALMCCLWSCRLMAKIQRSLKSLLNLCWRCPWSIPSKPLPRVQVMHVSLLGEGILVFLQSPALGSPQMSQGWLALCSS